MSETIIQYENQEGKVSFKDGNIQYNLEKPDIIIDGGGVIGGKYSFDNTDTNAIPGSPVINAVDINWGAHLPITGATIDTTSDLLRHIDGNQSSIPILDNYAIENASTSLPDKYISINTGRDLQLNEGNNYLNILFSSIRALQAEVVKLRNTFKYGLNSYNDTNTALGNVVTEYENDEENEPLWAVDENDLSEIREFDFPLDNSLLIPSQNAKTFTDYLEISDYAKFSNNNSITVLSEIEDPKIFLYFTTANLNIIINFKNRTDENDIISIDLSSLTNKNFASEKYDIMLCLSKQVHENLNDVTSKLVSNNYIYISIGEYLFGKTYLEGYYNGSTLQKNPVYTFNNIYDIDSIEFGNNKIWKLNAYSKEQDFSKEVIPSTPSDNDYKYGVAHITIRSVKTKDILDSIQDKLQENELIFVENTSRLYIKSKGNIINIGASGGDEEHPGENDNMTKEQLIESLRDLGIVIIEGTDGNGNPINDINIDNIQNINTSNININSTSDDNQININSGTSTINMANIGSITLINEETGKKFTLTIDAYGNLKTDEIVLKELFNLNENKQLRITQDNQISLLDENQNKSRNNIPYNMRGFHSSFNIVNSDDSQKNVNNSSYNSDQKLNADRIKISSIYAPLVTDKIHGCTHSFIELENISNEEFPLDGVYLHYGRTKTNYNNFVDNDYSKMYHLALKGSIKPNSTYLIRCKKYAEASNVNTYINVDTYDQEWYDNGELLDLSEYKNDTKVTGKEDETYTYQYGFALTYTNFKIYDENDNIDIEKTTELQEYLKNIDSTDIFLRPDTKTGKLEYEVRCDFIDCISINAAFGSWDICTDFSPNNLVKYKNNSFFKQKGNSIYRNTFALDPAKQAFNSLNSKDSSRCRHANSKTDLNTLNLDKEYISFPKSALVKKVADYKPRASFENKTVCTDKTQLDKTKPNIVTCSFGMNIYTTRCFNWISIGIFDEFVWLYDENNTLIGKFESYKDGDGNVQAEEFTDTKKCRRKHFDSYANNVIYKRIISQFPATDFKYTSHKCIIEFKEPATTPTTYKYIIARESIINKNQPSEEYRSDVMEFTLRPTTCTPKIYQTTDQQGFHWIEYQVWTAAADEIRHKIDNDLEQENIIPIVINTGDMTQNGTRYSEWLDYYNGGYEIFKKYEQNNIVGNNDLCGTDPLILGTGDDDGKSNGYYFHIFNCVDVDETNLPIIDAFTSDNINKYPSREAKVIPSLYYLNISYDNNNNPTKRMLMINSELTKINCRDWYNLYVIDNHGDSIPNTDDKKGFAVNAYTGFTIVNESTSANYFSYEAENLKFRTVYDMLCKMTNDSNIKYIAVCHEMPFTVITRDSLVYNETSRYRSLSNKAKLVGSHLNQIDETDIGPGIYWFSRLLEYRNIKVCIGGHKHTYATTYPICENYYWEYNNELNNSDICEEYYFESWNNSAKEVKYGEGKVKVIEMRDDGATVEVLENTSTDPNAEDFVGQQFNIALITDTDEPIQLHTLNNEPIDIWVTVEKKKYYWSFLQPIPMAQISKNYDIEHPNDPNNPVNKYSLEWELIKEQQTINEETTIINRNRVIWKYDETICKELKYWNDLVENYNETDTSSLKKYNTDIGNTHEKTNLSKFPFCFTKGYHAVNDFIRPGTDSDYKNNKLLNTYDFTNSKKTMTEYLPSHYSLIENTKNENNKKYYINSDGDLFKQNVNHPVRYFMMQATGYKLKSNKELPSESQRFSNIIPLTTSNANTGADSPAGDQQRPMFGEITFVKNNNGEEYINLYIIRINNILTHDETTFLATKWMFTQLDYNESPTTLECVREFNDGEIQKEIYKWNESSRSYGVWKNINTQYQPIISIQI